MSNTVTTTISNAVFLDGTVLSGSFTATYNPDGSIASVTGASFTATGQVGTTVFTNGYALPYANPSSQGLYELTFATSTGSAYQGLYIDYAGENPDGLYSRMDQSTYTSIREMTGTGTYGLQVLANGGTAVNVACFAAGTAIRTEAGEVPVEQLAIGDLVTTVSGEQRPIRWIGRRSYGGRFYTRQTTLHPVVFEPGSLGEGLPHRRLRVSQRHAMFLDGQLVPAVLLVNGASIFVDAGAGSVDYFHIELDSHDVIWAEGAASETFRDEDSRGVFHNAAEALHAAEAPGALYAARTESGFALERIRSRLMVRRAA